MTSLEAATSAQSAPGAGLLAGSARFAERLPMLRKMLDQAAVQASETWRALASAPVNFVLQDIASGPAEELLWMHDGRSLVGVLNAEGWDGRTLLIADTAVVAIAVEMLLGSDGSEQGHIIDRNFTKIEQKLTYAALHQLTAVFEKIFASISEPRFAFEEVTPRIGYQVFGRRSNPAVIARFRVQFAEQSGELLLAIPQSLLAPFRQTLARAEPEAVAKHDPDWKDNIQKEITRTSVSLVAILDEQPLTLGDIAGFKVGQLLPLEATPQSRIRVECNGDTLMHCQLGKSGGYYTLRVEEFVDKQQEFMDDILGG